MYHVVWSPRSPVKFENNTYWNDKQRAKNRIMASVCAEIDKRSRPEEKAKMEERSPFDSLDNWINGMYKYISLNDWIDSDCAIIEIKIEDEM